MTSPPLAPLPIDSLLPEVVERLRLERSVVIEAPPGAGKTTRVPLAILEGLRSFEGASSDGEVLVLEPRRLAARLAARRVAEELGEAVGERVGYSVRYEDVSSARTRLRFVTHGVLLRRLLADPLLPGVAAVVLDEFHERNLDGDLALALLARLQRGQRPDLRLAVMSATLDAEPVARFLGAPRLRSEGRRFEVAVEYAAQVDERRLEDQVASAVRRLVEEGLAGDVLVFLPGAAEIRKAASACSAIASRGDLMVLTLHGDQSPAEQDRAIRRSERRKVILSTNVAETSVTIDGVVAVVDSGLARRASHAPWSGLPTLKIAKIARAAATQRAGRAGRTGPGKAVRLYTRHDHDSRPEFETPEIRRLDLAEALQFLHAAGIREAASLEWLEAPPLLAVEAAEVLLSRLGALDARRALTPLGKKMARLPVHPRLGRLVCEAEARGVTQAGCRIAALLSDGDRSLRGQELGPVWGDSDVLEDLGRSRKLDGGAAANLDRAEKALFRVCRKDAPRPTHAAHSEESLRIAILAAYPDRVAKRRRSGEPEFLLSGGGSAVLSPASVVRDAELIVAVRAEERAEMARQPHAQFSRLGSSAKVVVHSASAIEPEWLLDLQPDAMRDAEEVHWDERAERVELVRRLYYDELILDETRSRQVDPELAAAKLAEVALGLGPRAFGDGEAIDRFLARMAMVATAAPEVGLQIPDESTLREALFEVCRGRSSYAELRAVSLVDGLRARLSSSQARDLDRLAPERVTLPGGKAVRVEYESGKPPHLASRMQDFFGMADGPKVAAGRVPVTLHLLAPNQRAVQVTSDLAGFWERHYPSVRRELMRKYPRHSWPEDGRHATPPAPGRR